jgi:hypothetical protein
VLLFISNLLSPDASFLQQPVQLVPVATKVVSSNPTQGKVYSIQHYVMKFVNDLRQVGGKKLFKTSSYVFFLHFIQVSSMGELPLKKIIKTPQFKCKLHLIVSLPQRNIQGFRVRVMVFNATFNNISVISWWSVLLVEETRVPGQNHRPVASH